MAGMKNYLFELAERNCMDPDGLSANELLRLETRMHLEFDVPQYDADMEAFFEDLFKGGRYGTYWLMVSDNEGTYNICSYLVSELIDIANVLSKYKVNLYFCPNAFCGWRIDANVIRTNAIFIDIDDIDGVDFSTMDSQALATWLMDTYDIPDSLLPNWCVSSGHGLHLYYLIDSLDLRNEDNRELRREFTDYLITYFGADKACRNSSRILRVPKSFNVKHEERMTTLHHLNTSPDRDIMRLIYFYCSEYVIEEYMQKCQEAKNAKSRATREANKSKSSKKEKESVCKEKLREEKIRHNRNDAKQVTKSVACKGLEGMTYYTHFDKKDRYWNIIKDLHNYYLRHVGKIHGCRNNFFLIMANYLKYIMLLESAIEFLEKYMDDDNREEAMTTITRVYQRKGHYRFKNITIAELLNFTEYDIEQSYCNFSKERIDKARKEILRKGNQKLSEKRKAERAVAENKECLYMAVKENYTNLTVKQLAEYLGVSVSTIKRIRKKIREED